MRAVGLKTLRRTREWLRSRFGTAALVLGYHRIATPEWDPFNLSVRPEFFEQHLQVLSEYASPVALSSLMRGLKSHDLPRRAVVLTIDDGYHDILETAAPLLVQHGIPATVFVISGLLGKEPWWDTLSRLVYQSTRSVRDFNVRVGHEDFDFSHASHPGARSASAFALIADLHKRLMHDTSAREEVFGRLRALSGHEQCGNRPASRLMSEEEVRRISAFTEISIGAHTQSHPPLSYLSENDQSQEIAESKARLESLIDDEITHFSYPHGAFTHSTQGLVQASGFELACGSRNGMVVPRVDPFALPRFWVPDVDGHAFAKWLGLWLAGR